jgi:hypothetical protein
VWVWVCKQCNKVVEKSEQPTMFSLCRFWSPPEHPQGTAPVEKASNEFRQAMNFKQLDFKRGKCSHMHYIKVQLKASNELRQAMNFKQLDFKRGKCSHMHYIKVQLLWVCVQALQSHKCTEILRGFNFLRLFKVQPSVDHAE